MAEKEGRALRQVCGAGGRLPPGAPTFWAAGTAAPQSSPDSAESQRHFTCVCGSRKRVATLPRLAFHFIFGYLVCQETPRATVFWRLITPPSLPPVWPGAVSNFQRTTPYTHSTRQLGNWDNPNFSFVPKALPLWHLRRTPGGQPFCHFLPSSAGEGQGGEGPWIPLAFGIGAGDEVRGLPSPFGRGVGGGLLKTRLFWSKIGIGCHDGFCSTI